MKVSAILTVALFGVSAATIAHASSAPNNNNQPPIEHYNYGMRLDISKLLSQSDVPDVCGVVPMRMTYEDSQGKQHILAYEILGSGCNND